MEDLDPAQARIEIKGDEARHMLQVLRMGKGHSLILAGPGGIRLKGRIDSVEGGIVTVAIEEQLTPVSPPPVEIVLCQSLLKAPSMDLVVQKASELGLSLLIPFASERTVVKLTGDKVERKLSHWKGIAKASLKQSDRNEPLEIETLAELSALVGRDWGENSLKLILWEGERGQGIKALIRGKPPNKRVVALVGPEGGFSKREVNQAMAGGFEPVSLGPRILRAETAALTLITLIQYEWGDLS